MALISDKLNKILSAVFGKDVRQALHDGLDAINRESENTTARQKVLEETFDHLTINAGNSNAEIVAARVKNDGTSFDTIGKRLNDFDEHLETIENETIANIYNKIFKPDFAISTYWGEVTDKMGGSFTYNEQQVKDNLQTWKAHGIREIIFIFHISCNTTTGEMFIGESMTLFKQYMSLIDEYGMKVKCIKVHRQQFTDDEIMSYGVEKFKTNYKSLVNTLASYFSDKGIEYFIPFNELSCIYSTTHNDYVLEVLNMCKGYGYKVGISTAGTDETYNLTDSIKQCVDGFFINYYQSITSKGNKANNYDAILSFAGNELIIISQYLKQEYPNKDVTISETGVKDYWEALIKPETSFGTERTEGAVQDVYLNGVFNCLNEPSIDNVWWWFGLAEATNVTVKTTNYYLRGVNNEF